MHFEASNDPSNLCTHIESQLIQSILDKAYRHCVTDAILLQRMTGRTIFSLSNGYVGIRLETYYASKFTNVANMFCAPNFNNRCV